MKVGVPGEIKIGENRVALTPEGALAFTTGGHDVRIETNAGTGSGFSDAAYEAAGAQIVSAEAAWDSEMVLKVKEPQESEYDHLSGQILFTYLHLAGVDPSVTERLLSARTTAIAYETVEDANGRLPLLAPMSGVAGIMAATVGNHYLAQSSGGKGILLGEILGNRFGNVLVIGDGVVGRHAARAAVGLGAKVRIAGRHPERASQLADDISPEVRFLLSEPNGIARAVESADLVVGGVLVPGACAPQVVTEEMVQAMERGSVIVDVSIDQGGCVETSRPTSHADPIFVQHGVIHYCVTNMPGAYPRTSTLALTSATLPYALRIANDGLDEVQSDPGFSKGVNTHGGQITLEPVARDLRMLDRYRPLA